MERASKLKRWDRADQVGLEALLWLWPALAALSTVPRLVSAARGESIELVAELAASLLKPETGVEDPLTGTLRLVEPTSGQQVVALVPHLLTVLLVAGVTALLLGVVRALRAGEPFVPSSARRLTAAAALVGVGGMLQQLVGEAVRTSLLEGVTPLGERLPVVGTLSFWPLAVMLLLAFFAEVFSRGAALRADVDGLV